jgi:hydrogenase nickel incorporation protein HypA/HybF
MHELSVACALVEQVEEAARREGARRVLSVQLTLGGLSGVERDALELAFPLAVEGTLLENARLDIDEVPAVAHCRDCGAEAAPALPALLCSACGSFAIEIEGGRELSVRSMEVS